MTNEEWYDAEIGPKLRELADACTARKMSFQAYVEYAPEKIAQTYVMVNAGLKSAMVQYCARTAPNIDSYIIGLIKHCREKGIDVSESMVVRTLTNSPESGDVLCRCGHLGSMHTGQFGNRCLKYPKDCDCTDFTAIGGTAP